jgi:hypothetical protein
MTLQSRVAVAQEFIAFVMWNTPDFSLGPVFCRRGVLVPNFGR